MRSRLQSLKDEIARSERILSALAGRGKCAENQEVIRRMHDECRHLRLPLPGYSDRLKNLELLDPMRMRRLNEWEDLGLQIERAKQDLNENVILPLIRLIKEQYQDALDLKDVQLLTGIVDKERDDSGVVTSTEYRFQMPREGPENYRTMNLAIRRAPADLGDFRMEATSTIGRQNAPPTIESLVAVKWQQLSELRRLETELDVHVSVYIHLQDLFEKVLRMEAKLGLELEDGNAIHMEAYLRELRDLVEEADRAAKSTPKGLTGEAGANISEIQTALRELRTKLTISNPTTAEVQHILSTVQRSAAETRGRVLDGADYCKSKSRELLISVRETMARIFERIEATAELSELQPITRKPTVAANLGRPAPDAEV